jgi:hypothetical protein
MTLIVWMGVVSRVVRGIRPKFAKVFVWMSANTQGIAVNAVYLAVQIWFAVMAYVDVLAISQTVMAMRLTVAKVQCRPVCVQMAILMNVMNIIVEVRQVLGSAKLV